MTASSIPERHRTETTIYRALLQRLQTLVPPGSPAAALLEASRPVFDPSAERPPVPLDLDDDATLEDPVTAALRHDARAVAIMQTQRDLSNALRHSVSAGAWQMFLAFENSVHEHAALLESIIFAHAFRLGQLYPAHPQTEEAMHDPVLRRLARAATDMRSAPGQRLRVLLAAASQALEELFPTPAGSPS